MPLHPHFAQKLSAALQGITSIEDALRDPATAAKLAQAFKDEDHVPAPAGTTEERVISATGGTLRVRIYRPQSTGTAPAALIWVHGGGFAGGSIDMPESDTVARELAFIHGVLTITVDYSLSNGDSVVYPIPHQQVVDAIRWAQGAQSELGYASGRLAVGGASAGANLATGAVLELRDNHELLPDALINIYPMLHRTLINSAARESEMTQALGPTRMSQGVVDHMYRLYTNGQPATYASIEGHDLQGLPRSLTVVSEFDDLRPSGETFHQDAVAAGVASTIHVAEGMPHGHLDRTRQVPEVSATVADMANFIKRA